MTETLRDMMTERVERAPEPRIDIDQVVRSGRHRVWRHRALGGAAACAVIAAAVLVAPALHQTSDDPGISGTGAFEVRKVTYAQGSTIHYGDRTISVPHEVRSFVQTDDGFVFAGADDTIYFTNGDDTEAIGHAGAFTRLAADDSGSYVAWVEIDKGETPETVVYDTGTGAEVLRTSEGNGPGRGYYSDYDEPSTDALDGETVYVHNAEGFVTVDIPTGRTSVLFSPDDPRTLDDAAGGMIGLVDPRGTLAVRSGADGADQTFPGYAYAQLSPSGTRAFTSRVSDDKRAILDLPSGDDVTPTWGDYRYVFLSQWIDDDTLVAYGPKGRGLDDVLRCSIASGNCVVAVPSVRDARYPFGYNSEAY
jgi:hypothetical protein